MKYRVIVISLSLFAVFFFHCNTDEQDSPAIEARSGQSSRQPNILLISIDTLRADYFTRDHMPLIYDWARNNAIMFTKAHAPSSWTLPSHVTMLTGLRPSVHGVELKQKTIPPELGMIQEQLQARGYRTYAFTSGAYVSKHFGFNRGFDHFWQINWRAKSSLSDDGDAFRTARSFLEDSAVVTQPFFLFLHTHMVHQFWTDFVPGGTVQTRKESRKKFSDECSFETRQQLYAARVKRCDSALFDFLQFVLGRFPHTQAIITSDHGEGLGDSYSDGALITVGNRAWPENEWTSKGHGTWPTPDITHVPLIVYGAGVGVSDRLVGIDRLPFLLLRMTEPGEPPAGNLFEERETVVSERRRRDESGRLIAIIRKDRFEITTVVDNDPASDQKEEADIGNEHMTDDIKTHLEALGYLN